MNSMPTDVAISRDELREKTLGGLRWVSLARLVAEACAFGSMVLLAHLVPPAEFGALAVALIVNELANTVAGEGIGTPLVQRRTIERAHLQGAALLSLACGVGLTLATLALAPLAAEALFGARVAHLFMLFSPAFLIAGASAVPRAMLQRRLDFRLLSLVDIAVLVSSITATVVLAAAGLDAEALVIGVLAGGLVSLALLGTIARPPLPRWRPAAMREVAAFGGPAVLSALAWVGSRNADYAILAARLGIAQVGFYYRAFTLAVEYQRKISGIVVQMALPVFSRAESLEHMRAIRTRLVRVNSTVLFPLLALFVAVAPAFVPWLLGERWEPAVAPAQILAMAGAAAVVNTSTGYAVLAAGKPGAMLVFNVVQLASFGALVFVTAPLGLTWVCASVAAFRVAVVIASYRLLLARHVGVPTRQMLSDIAPAATASAALLCTCLPLVSGLQAAGVPVPAMVALTAMVAGTVYLAIIRGMFQDAWGDLQLVASRLLGLSRRPSGGAAAPVATSSR
jgi:O-antigen/teichoic acid export membrane protein